MTNYKKAVSELIDSYDQEFKAFGEVHDKYKSDQTTWQDEFDRLGKPILRHIEDAERKLCSKMEGAGKSKFSAGLAEKFRTEMKKVYPLIDFIGVKIT